MRPGDSGGSAPSTGGGSGSSGLIAQAWYDPMILYADGCRRAARRRR